MQTIAGGTPPSDSPPAVFRFAAITLSYLRAGAGQSRWQSGSLAMQASVLGKKRCGAYMCLSQCGMKKSVGSVTTRRQCSFTCKGTGQMRAVCAPRLTQRANADHYRCYVEAGQRLCAIIRQNLRKHKPHELPVVKAVVKA